MDDLVQFVTARLDEDAGLAEQAAHCGAPEWNTDADSLLLLSLANRQRLAERGVPEALAGAVEAHHARHDPARVLAEVEAKREVVRLAIRANDFGPTFMHGFGAAMEQALRLLALPHATHPDYRETWRP